MNLCGYKVVKMRMKSMNLAFFSTYYWHTSTNTPALGAGGTHPIIIKLLKKQQKGTFS